MKIWRIVIKNNIIVDLEGCTDIVAMLKCGGLHNVLNEIVEKSILEQQETTIGKILNQLSS